MAVVEDIRHGLFFSWLGQFRKKSDLKTRFHFA